MIIFFSKGRLGNLLFQYNFLASISKPGEKIIVFGMKELESLIDMEVKLIHFQKSRINDYLINYLLLPFLLKPLIKLRLISYVYQARHNQKTIPFYSINKGVFNLSYVQSDYYQSENFITNRRIHFKIKEMFILEALNTIKIVPNGKEPVFVHIRRGDYLRESYKGNKGINLPEEYYRISIEIISKKCKNPFFIFLGDDPDFVKFNFRDIPNKIITQNRPVVDLTIMSLCRYGVVSNSSFSWWGSYLMASKEIICFPKYWLGWKVKEESHQGIIPTYGIEVDFIN